MTKDEAYRIISEMRCSDADKKVIRKQIDKGDPHLTFMLRAIAVRNKEVRYETV